MCALHLQYCSLPCPSKALQKCGILLISTTSQPKLERRVHHHLQWCESSSHLAHSEEKPQPPFQKAPISPAPEPPAPREGTAVSGPGSTGGKVGTITAATTEHNKTRSGFCSSGCKLQGVPDSHPHSLLPTWEIGVCRETIITWIHHQAKTSQGTLEKLQHLRWYVACAWADVLKE